MRFFAAEAHDVPAQYVLDVVNSTADILRYAKTIELTDIAAPNNAPDWFGPFLSTWQEIKTHAMTWINLLEPTMNATIAGVIGFNTLVTNRMKEALRDIDSLVQNPNQPDVKAHLASTLSELLDLLAYTPDELSSFDTMLTTFQQQMAGDKGAMDGAVTNAKNTVGADNAKIDDLNRDINSLRDKINTYNALLTVETVGLYAGIAITVIGVGCTIGGLNPAGGVLIGTGVAMIGGSVVGKIATDAAIANAYASIAIDQKQIGDLNGQIALLVNLQDLLNKLAALNANAQSAAAKIKAFWKEFSDDVSVFLTSVNDTKGDTDYRKAQLDIRRAMQQWDALQTLLNPLEKISFEITKDPVIIAHAA